MNRTPRNKHELSHLIYLREDSTRILCLDFSQHLCKIKLSHAMTTINEFEEFPASVRGRTIESRCLFSDGPIYLWKLQSVVRSSRGIRTFNVSFDYYF